MKYQVVHSSLYQNDTAQDIEQEMLDFVGDCNDITYCETLNVGIDIETLKDLFFQVCVLAEPEENLSLMIERSKGDGYDFITVDLCKPIDKGEGLQKLYNIKRSVAKMRESFDKMDSRKVRESMEEIEESL